MTRATRHLNELHTHTAAGERLALAKDVHGYLYAGGELVLHMRRGADGVALSTDTHTVVISADDYTRLVALPAPAPDAEHDPG